MNYQDPRCTPVGIHVHKAQKAMRAFCDQMGAWCRCNGIYEAIYEKAASYYHGTDEVWVSRPTMKAMKEAERAFSDDEFDLADHLADVIQVMLRRDTIKFKADPKKWIDRQRFLSGEVMGLIDEERRLIGEQFK